MSVTGNAVENVAAQNHNSQNEEVVLPEGKENIQAQELSANTDKDNNQASNEDKEDNQAEEIASNEDENEVMELDGLKNLLNELDNAVHAFDEQGELDEEVELDEDELLPGNQIEEAAVDPPPNPTAPVPHGRRPRLVVRRSPIPMPILKLKAVKASSFVAKHSSSAQTIQFHVASLILPPQCLRMMTVRDVAYPVHFQLTNPDNEKSTCCGVVEFTADHGTCSIPDWIMDNLNIKEGSKVSLELKVLELGTFVKLEPQSKEFLKIEDPKAVLEETLRKFPCISTGDIVQIPYKGEVYLVKVLETKPTHSVKITDSDLNVDFAPPVDYVDPNNNEVSISGPFSGKGQRLDGQKVSAADTKPAEGNIRKAIPDWTFKIGNIDFNRRPKPQDISTSTSSKTPFKPFSGAGFTTSSPTSTVNGEENSLANEGNESGAPPRKVRKTEGALDVWEAANNSSASQSSESVDVIEYDDDALDMPSDSDDVFDVSSDDEIESEEDEPEPDDPKDPDYTEDMEID